MDKSTISRDTENLNNTIKQLNLMDTYGELHLIVAEYTFFSSVHGSFIKLYQLQNHIIILKY